ncbi:hypothetical protein B0W01_19640 [Serratia marcescens]|nr:hypothetical protein B0W01_19640 [Serratia marcescens]
MLSIYPSSFKLQRCWLPALTPVTYLSKLLGTHALAAGKQLQLFRAYLIPLRVQPTSFLVIANRVFTSCGRVSPLAASMIEL